MIHGTYYFGRKRVACRNAYCTTCQAPRFAGGLRSLVVWHLCFVPVLPVALIRRWYCTTCGNEINARRPSRPFILMAGVACAILMTFVGVMILLEGQEKETAIGCLVFGPLLAAGLVYAIRKGEHKNFAAATKAVPPLRADHCPYCEAPVFTTGTPRCHACKVDILTGSDTAAPV